jgi:hypothetical protein
VCLFAGAWGTCTKLHGACMNELNVCLRGVVNSKARMRARARTHTHTHTHTSTEAPCQARGVVTVGVCEEVVAAARAGKAKAVHHKGGGGDVFDPLHLAGHWGRAAVRWCGCLGKGSRWLPGGRVVQSSCWEGAAAVCGGAAARRVRWLEVLVRGPAGPYVLLLGGRGLVRILPSPCGYPGLVHRGCLHPHPL